MIKLRKKMLSDHYFSFITILFHFVSRIPWIDRESIVKKIERMQKENALLQHKIDEMNKKGGDEKKEVEANDHNGYQV